MSTTQGAPDGEAMGSGTDAQNAQSHIDAFMFARQAKRLEGSIPLMRLARFMEGLPEQSGGEAGLARWAVEGGTGQGSSRTGHPISGQPLLRLRVRAAPMLVCQRCNQPFVYPVDNTVVLQLVKSEEDLDEDLSETQDEDFADDLPEKVVGSHNFDLLAQVEDELILSVPYVPRHDVCPGAQAESGETSQEPAVKRPSPFAVLEQLKHKD
ncbi:Uncharacterized ACR%2C COG1399 [Bordetella pertussis]|nr:Uncharacterized ACR%2C COG1399 [Bordetella pertussis]